MVKKVKNRHRVLLLSQDPHTSNDVVMLLSSHGYLVDVVTDFEDPKGTEPKDAKSASFKMNNYKPSIFIADVDLLPEDPYKVLALFTEARKKPVFLLINRDEHSSVVKAYLEDLVDDLLTLPTMDADKLYRKVKRAAEYNRMQHEIEYHSGIVFILKMIIPILMVIVFILTNR